jgi:hypothetical protein
MRHLDRYTLPRSDSSQITAPANRNLSSQAAKIFDLSGLSCCAALFLVALFPRLLFCIEVLQQFGKLPVEMQNSFEIGYLTLDSPEYLAIAKSLWEGQLTQSISLIRPIGYPAFLALLGTRPATILEAQAVLLSIVPVCTFVLVRLLSQNIWISIFAGLVSCISPTGIALGSLVMSDGPFAALFAILFVALIYGVLVDSWRWIAVSAFVSGLAALVRPILLLWPFISVVLYVLIAGPRWNFQLRRVETSDRLNILTLFAVPVAFMVCWASLNYLHSGIFSVSETGGMTLREYLSTKTEEWGKAGGRPSDLAIKKNMTDVRNRLEALPNEERVRAYSVESWTILRKYPIAAAEVFVDDFLKNSTAGWDYFPRQLPFSQDKFGSLLSRVSKLESWCRRAALIVVTFGAVILLIASRDRPWLTDTKFVGTFVSMVLTIYYFVLFSGTTFWTGPRIVYPTEMIQIAAVMLLANLIIRAYGARSTREPPL